MRNWFCFHWTRVALRCIFIVLIPSHAVFAGRSHFSFVFSAPYTSMNWRTMKSRKNFFDFRFGPAAADSMFSQNNGNHNEGTIKHNGTQQRWTTIVKFLLFCWPKSDEALTHGHGHIHSNISQALERRGLSIHIHILHPRIWLPQELNTTQFSSYSSAFLHLTQGAGCSIHLIRQQTGVNVCEKLIKVKNTRGTVHCALCSCAQMLMRFTTSPSWSLGKFIGILPNGDDGWNWKSFLVRYFNGRTRSAQFFNKIKSIITLETVTCLHSHWPVRSHSTLRIRSLRPSVERTSSNDNMLGQNWSSNRFSVYYPGHRFHRFQRETRRSAHYRVVLLMATFHLISLPRTTCNLLKASSNGTWRDAW